MQVGTQARSARGVWMSSNRLVRPRRECKADCLGQAAHSGAKQAAHQGLGDGEEEGQVATSRHAPFELAQSIRRNGQAKAWPFCVGVAARHGRLLCFDRSVLIPCQVGPPRRQTHTSREATTCPTHTPREGKESKRRRKHEVRSPSEATGGSRACAGVIHGPSLLCTWVDPKKGAPRLAID